MRLRPATILRVLRWPAAALFLLLLSVGVGFFPQEPLRRLVERSLRGRLGAGAALGRLHVVPLLLRADVAGLRLEGNGFRLDLPRGRAILSPRALIGRAPRLRLVELDAPRLELRPAPPTAEPAPSLSGLRVERLVLRDASLRYDDGAGGGLDVPRLTADGSLGVGSLELLAPSVSWRGPSGSAPSAQLGPARARLSVSPSLDVTVESFELAPGRSRLALHGALAKAGALVADLALDARLDLAELGARLHAGDLLGVVALTGRITGPADSLRFALDATGTAGLAGWRLDGVLLHARYDAAGEAGDAGLMARWRGSPIAAEVRLVRGRVRGRVHGTELDLAALSGRTNAPVQARGDASLSWEGPLSGPLAVQAEVVARARQATAQARLNARAAGAVRLADRSLDLRWKAGVEGVAPAWADTQLHIEASGQARGPLPSELTAALAGEVSFAGPAQRNVATISGSVTSRGRDRDVSGSLEARGRAGWLRVEAAASMDRLSRASFRAQVPDLAGLVAGGGGALELDAEASGPLGQPVVSARARGTDLTWRGARLGALEASLQGTSQGAELHASLPALGARTDGELTLEPTPHLRGRLQLEETPLAPLAPPATGQEAMAGRVTAAVRYALDLRSPQDAAVTAEVTTLEVARGPVQLRAEPFRAQLQDRRLSLDGLRIAGAGLRLDARLDAGLARSSRLEACGALEGDLSALPLPLPAGWVLAGTTTADLCLRGTRDEPDVVGGVRFADLVARAPGLPELRVPAAAVALADGRARLAELQARVGAGTAALTGEIPFASVFPALRGGHALAPAQETRLTLRWEGVPLGAWEGSTAGTFELEGGLSTLDEARARLSLLASSLSVEGRPIQILPATLSLERGRLHVPGLTVRTDQGDLVITGEADLDRRTLDLAGRGSVDLRTLSPLVAEAALSGRAEVNLGVQGTFDAPRPRGSLRVSEGSLRLRDLPQALTAIQGDLELDGAAVRLDASGLFGGSEVRASGTAHTTAQGLSDLQVRLTGKQITLAYPPGLRSRLNLALDLSGRPGQLRLTGDVDVERGVYDLATAVGEALRAPSVAPASPALRSVGLDVRVRLQGPVLVRSAFGRLEATGEITARGDLAEPAPFGRLTVREGGRLDVQGREFTVTQGSLAYSGDWDPALRLEAQTAVREESQDYHRDYQVRTSVEGTLDAPSLSLSSDPPLSEAEIASLIATGHTSRNAADTGLWLAGGQAATLLAAPLAGKIAQTFGLDEITVRPDLVAKETDPSARFTFGKRLGRGLSLVYSAGLGGPETRFVQLEARPGRDLQLTGQRADDGSYRLGAGQRFNWGQARPDSSRRESRVELAEVRIEGTADETMRSWVRLAAGTRVTGFTLQEEAERLRQRLRASGRLDAEVGVRLEGRSAVVSLAPGPIYEWRIEGVASPPDLRGLLRQALFEADALELGRERLAQLLVSRGHARAEVEASVTVEGARRLLVLRARPGPRYGALEVRFPGAHALSTDALLAAAGGARRLLLQPGPALDAIRDAYRVRHFLAAQVGEVQVREEAKRLQLVVTVDEGPRANLSAVRFEGASLPDAELRAAAALQSGRPYDEAAVSAAAARVRRHYLALGYATAQVRPQPRVDGHDVELVLAVTEGERRAVSRVELPGNTRTRAWLIRRGLDLPAGTPLDPALLAAAERRLLDLGVFSRVALVPRDDDPSALGLELEEGPRFVGGYDFRWDTREGTSALVDGEARNLLGLGLSVGGRYRYGADHREARATLRLPAALAGGEIVGSLYRLEDDFQGGGAPITSRQQGFQLQESLRLPGKVDLLAGYRFRRNTTLAQGLSAEPIDVAGLDVSVLRNTRDDLLDPRRGEFVSLNLEIAPALLGSAAPFVKGYGQAALERSWANGSFTWAQSYRLGLAWGFGGEPVIAFERFRAGGANSLRGFGTNEVGPRDALGDPAGGEAVLVVNQELRYRHRSGLGGVLFYDGGNVFARVQDLRFDLRHTLGAGLRWASPVGLLRLDLGLPLARQPGEKGYQLFFSLGQAF